MPIEIVIKLLVFFFSSDDHSKQPPLYLCEKFLEDLRVQTPLPIYLMAMECKDDICSLFEALTSGRIKYR